MDVKSKRAGFALYEVLIGLTIFVVGVLSLGKSVQNCLNASTLTADEDRVRLILANRMAEVQATPGPPDEKKAFKIDSGFGEVVLSQTAVPAGLKDENNLELSGVRTVTLKAEWNRGGARQARTVEFYVYRAG